MSFPWPVNFVQEKRAQMFLQHLARVDNTADNVDIT